MATKTYKKFLTGAATAAMVVSAVAPVAAQGQDVADTAQNAFSDVGPKDYFMEITEARELGFLSGYQDGTFKPYNTMTRSDAVKMFAKYILATQDKSLDEYIKDNNLENAGNFNDVGDNYSDKELINYAKVVKHEGIFAGSNGDLNPRDSMQRQQMATTIVRAFNLQDKEGTPNVTDLDKAFGDHKKSVEILAENGVTNQTEFRPAENVNRGQFASFLVRAYKVSQGFDPGLPLSPIESVNAVNDITIKVGQTPSLPATVGVTYENGSTGTAAVKWDTSKLDNSKVGTYTLTGDVEGTDLSASVNVIVEANAIEPIQDVKITTTQLDDDTDKQIIEFTVNGQAVSLDQLKNVLGYTVEFQSTTPNLFVDKATGEVDENEIDINDYHQVKLVLTKEGKVYQSELTSVHVINKNATPAIGSIRIIQDRNGLQLSSGTLVTGEKVTIPTILSETGDVIKVSGDHVVTSSNEAVLITNGNQVTAVAPGTATITVTAGDKTYKTELTVKNEKRELSVVEPAQKSVKLAASGIRYMAIPVVAKDQYGDRFAITSANVNEVVSNPVIHVQNIADAANGASVLYVRAAQNAPQGSYNVYLKDEDNENLATVAVEVTKENAPVKNQSKLALNHASESKDNVLYVDRATDDWLTLNVKEFSSDGGFVGDAVVAQDYEIRSTDPTVATATIGQTANNVEDQSNIYVVAQDTGVTDIQLLHKGVVIDTYTVEVKEDPFIITDIQFAAPATVTRVGEEFGYDDLFEVEKLVDKDDIVKNVTLNKETTHFVRINEQKGSANTLYLDMNDNGFMDDGEQLGTVKLTVNGNVNFPVNATYFKPAFTTARGSEGKLVFTFEDNGGAVRASTAVTVAVPGQ